MAEERVEAEPDRSGDRVDPQPRRARRGGDAPRRRTDGSARKVADRDQDSRDRASRRNERVGTRAAEADLDLDGQDAARRRGQADGSAGDDRAAEPDTRGEQSSGRTVRRRAKPARGDEGRGHGPDEDGGDDQAAGDKQDSPDAGDWPSDHLSAGDAARAALRGLSGVIENEPVGVTQVSPRHDGWIVGIEVVELARVPSSADIMALYETELDMDGTMRAYRRVRRYARGRGDSEDR